jgi:hypothetical protein
MYASLSNGNNPSIFNQEKMSRFTGEMDFWLSAKHSKAP